VLYESGNLAATLTPISALLFLLLAAFPYNVGLAVYLSSMTILVASAPIHLVRFAGSKISFWPSICVTFSSLGVLVSLDRGNIILLFLPILYFLFHSLWRDHDRMTLILIVAASMLKWWAPILILIPLAVGKLKVSVQAVMGTIVGHSLGFVLYPEATSFLDRLKVTYAVVTDAEYASAVSVYAVSVSSVTGRIICLWPGGAECTTGPPRAFVPFGSLGISIISISVAAMAWFVMKRFGLRNPIGISAGCSLCFLAVPEAAPYNLCAVTASVLLIMRTEVRQGRASNGAIGYYSSAREWTLAFSLALGLVPVAFMYWPGRIEWGVDFLGGVGPFRLSAFAVPLAWLSFLMLATLQSLRSSRREV